MARFFSSLRTGVSSKAWPWRTLVREVSQQVARDFGRDAAERLSRLKALVIAEDVKEDERRRAKAGRSIGLAAARGRPAHTAHLASARARGSLGPVPSQLAARPEVAVRANVPVLRRKFPAVNTLLSADHFGPQTSLDARAGQEGLLLDADPR